MPEPLKPEPSRPLPCLIVGGTEEEHRRVCRYLVEAGITTSDLCHREERPGGSTIAPDSLESGICFLVGSRTLPETLALLTEARRARPALPVIVVTPDAAIGSELLALVEAGATDGVSYDSDDGGQWLCAIARARAHGIALAATVRAEHRARLLAEYVSDGLVLLQSDGTILTDSQLNRDMLGFSTEEVVGRNAFNLIHPDDRGAANAALTHVASTPGERVTVEIRIRGAEGHWLTLDAVVVNRLADPHVRAIVVAYRDVTARRHAEAAARAIEQHHRDVVDSIRESIYEADLTGRLTFANRSAFERFGYSREEFEAGVNCADLIVPEHRDRLRQNIARLTAGELVSGEYTALRRDGSTFPVASHSTLVVREGQPVGFCGLLVDISAQKRAEQSLRESEERHRSLIRNAVYGIYRSTVDGRFLEVNPALASMLGYDSEAELVELGVESLYVSAAERQRLIEEYRRSDRVDGVEVQWQKQDGTPITVRLSGRVIRDANGALDGYEMIAEDVTERRLLETQFRQAQKMEAIGRLAGGISHDFNNLLTAILGYNDLLLAQLTDDDPRRIEVLEVRKAVDRASNLTRQLLAFSRKQVIQPKPIDLNTVVVGFERMLRRLIGEDLRLVIVPTSGLGLVLADQGQIEQIIMNLAVNARDAMPDGGTLLIETSNVALDAAYARQHADVTPGEYVMLAISDTGIGMDDTVKARLFEPFFSTKDRGKGTGLGLATVYGIVQQAGGHIWVYSEPGRGATFKIYLPRIRQQPHVAEAARDERSPVSLGSETVLVVEDEMSVRQLVCDVLMRAGYHVVEAADPRDALVLMENHTGPIDLLVTDIVMPGMSGKELASRMIARRHDMVVLFMSGYTDQVVIQSGVLGSDVAFLQKPFTPDGLTRKARELLDARSARQQPSGS